MTQTCSKCSRVNPADASYCYYDGSVLGQGGRGVNGGPINTGAQPFHNQFVFPSGQVCRNFDELAMACQRHWAEAVGLLKQGYLESFLGGLGRADLAMAAREAAHFPDQDRGLDQLLEKLPSKVVDPPQLDVVPREVNLGQIKVGEDRDLELHLTNQGMRLLYGAVRCEDSVWLAVGEAPGAPQKLFQFDTELLIPLHVRGKHLRAGNKPLEGRLTVESNGGNATVVVRADVPVKPFPDGALGGARSPRQLAEKAKANPKEAAALFENGAVARWYEANGWTYPVQGPSASGIGAVQQFFEALGLTPPPRVEISHRALAFQANVGDRLEQNLEVRTPEKRPVYASGSTDSDWVQLGRVQLNGRTAVVPVIIPAVPDRPGETLTARVTVRANGNQRFEVPITVEVAGFSFGAFAFDAPAAAAPAAEPAPVAAATAAEPAPRARQKEKSAPEVPAAEAAAPAAPARSRRARTREKTNWVHLVPAGLLVLALLGVLTWDLVKPPAEGGGGDLSGSYWKVPVEDPQPRLAFKFNDRMRFGILMVRESDPNDPDKRKRLTGKEDGWTNNTCIRLDGHEDLFGTQPGQWAGQGGRLKQVALPKPRDGWTSTWEYPTEKVTVRQTTEVIPNEQTHLLDTALVAYLVENKDTAPHKVGLRMMLDTYIGANDGVPFVIPGRPGLLETMEKFEQKDIPDYVEALERPDLKDPGTVAQVGLKLPPMKVFPTDPDQEPLETLVICRWPGNSEKRWTWDFTPMNQPAGEPKDSCVVLYWGESDVGPGEKRSLLFTYGLGVVASSGSGTLGLSAGGSFRPGGVFTITALVKDPEEGQKVKINLPPGLVLEPNQAEEQTLQKARDYSQVSWRVRAEREGDYTVEVSTGVVVERQPVHIRAAGVFR